MVARLGYREVATHYGCAYKNDGYRVMEEMAERVPGVTYKESRTLCVDDAMGVGGHHIELTFAHPDLAGGCEPTKRTRRTEGTDYSVVITGVLRTPTRAAPPHEIHTALPVTHGGSNRLVTVECVYFCETEGVAFAIPLYYNVIIESLFRRERHRPYSYS